MDELIAWLGQQLDEDERVAREAMPHAADDGIWTAGADNWQAERIDGAGITIYDEGGHSAEQAAHIARWDPDRVLAEVEAKRRILQLVELAQSPVAVSLPFLRGKENGYREAMTEVAQLLAQPYAGRAGWREEWRTE